MRQRLDRMTGGALHATVFLLCLSLVLAGGNYLFTAHEVNSTRAAEAAALKATASVRQLCLAGNESRAQQITLWEHIITIARPPAHETPAAARKRLAGLRAFEAYIRKVFAPRDCSHPLTPTH